MRTRVCLNAAALFLGCSFVAGLPGCIAWEIRDEIHGANQRIDEVDGVLIQTSQRLELTNERIETANNGIARTDELLEDVQASITQTNTQLAEVQASLRQTHERLDLVTGVLVETNPKLTTANEGIDRLRILQDVQASLHDVNSALAPLQKTMASLSGTMSFFGLGGEETPAAEAAAPAAAPGEAPAPAAEATAPAEPRSANLLLGTWILAHPAAPAAASPPSSPPSAGTTPRATPSGVLDLLSDGRYVTGENGKVRGGGAWVRSGATLTLTPSGGAAGAWEIVSLSTRALTVRAGEELWVYARP